MCDREMGWARRVLAAGAGVGSLAATLLVSPNAAALVGHGAAVAVGDFNGVGGWEKDEVVVGAPYENYAGSSTGSITVFWRDPSNPSTWLKNWIAQDRLSGSLFTGGGDGGVESWDYFGKVLAVGDFDKDGYKDLAIGVPMEDLGDKFDAGCVHVLYGASSGPLGMPFRQSTVYLTRANAFSHPLAATPSTSDNFGHSLAAGDFDGNGYDDLAVGAPGVTINGNASAGAVFVFYSVGVGFDAVREYTLYQGGPYSPAGTAQAAESFGWSLAAGNFNGDLDGTGGGGTGPSGSRRIMDLAVSAIGQTVNGAFSAGDVTVYYGRAFNKFSTTNNWVISQASLEAPENNDSFGYSLTAGDFNSDCSPHSNAINCASLRQDDLAIGVPYESVGAASGAGLVHVLYGTTGGLSLTNAQTWNSGNFSTAANSTPVQAFANFGLSLATGDVIGEPNGGCAANGCNPWELVIGEPYRDRPGWPDSGRAYVLKGQRSSLNQFLTAGYSNYPVVEPNPRQSSSNFGSSLAVGSISTAVGSINSMDVLVGSPGTDNAQVFYGAATEMPSSTPIPFGWPW